MSFNRIANSHAPPCLFGLWAGKAAKQKLKSNSRGLQVRTQSVFSLLLPTGESRKELSFELICSNIGLNLTWGPINVQMTSCRSQLKILKVSERPNASKEGSVSTVIYYYVSKAITPPEYISGYILCV